MSYIRHLTCFLIFHMFAMTRNTVSDFPGFLGFSRICGSPIHELVFKGELKTSESGLRISSDVWEGLEVEPQLLHILSGRQIQDTLERLDLSDCSETLWQTILGQVCSTIQ